MSNNNNTNYDDRRDDRALVRPSNPPPTSSRPPRRRENMSMVNHTGRSTPEDDDTVGHGSRRATTQSNSQANARQYRPSPQITDHRSGDDRYDRDRRDREYPSEDHSERRRSTRSSRDDGAEVIRPARTRNSRDRSRPRTAPPQSRETNRSQTRRGHSRDPYHYHTNGRGERERRYDKGTEPRSGDRPSGSGRERRSSRPPASSRRSDDHGRERRRSERRPRSPSPGSLEKLARGLDKGLSKIFGSSK
jgi:hypothetical protein